MNIIAADIGGTKSWFVMVDRDKPQTVLYEAKYNSGDYDCFEPLLRTFLKESGCDNSRLGVLTLALPGVVNGSEARLTNLPWIISKSVLSDEFDIGQIHFINDFQASALGTLHLQAEDTVVLNNGVHKNDATRVAVGAGTGLGVSWLLCDGASARAWSTEGGHVDFAPVNEDQVGLLKYLMARHEHVSYERLLSGDGLVTLYQYCSAAESTDIDAARVHSEAERNNEAACRAMALFVSIYGAFVGNMALLFRPEGGIYITGGIGAKIIPWMRSDDFISAYFNKGRMRALTEKTSVYLVTNERVGVIGAISEAVKHAGSK
jgi:glucokinase